ncbi:MAG: PAS domain S-box protein [Verrucomicrobia bacterium]|nr:PAS domain S-box protein [Verrucomicrobiota bacterium]
MPPPLTPNASASEFLWQRAMETSHAAVVLADATGRLTYANPAFLALWGYSDARQAIGRPGIDFWEDPAAAQATLETLARQGHWVGEIRGRRCDGTGFPVHALANFVRDDAGKVAGLVASFVDLTERHRTEEALRRNEARLRLAIDASNQGLFDLDLISGEASYTPQYAAMLGYDPAQFRANLAGWTDMLHPEDRDLALRTLGECVSGQKQSYAMEYRLRRGDGGWEWVLSTGKVVDHDSAGRPTRLVGTHLCITERRRAEQALLESQYFLDKSQEVARLGSYKLDVAAGTWLSSPYLDEIFGIKPDYPHTVDGWSALIFPEERESVTRYLTEHVLHGGHRFDRTYRIVRPVDGQIRWVHGLGEVTYAEDRRPLRMIGTIQDVTDRRQAEAVLDETRRLYSELVDQVPLGVYRIEVVGDRQIRFVYVSDRYCEITGVSRAAILSDPGSVYSLIHPEDRPRYDELTRAALVSRQPFCWEGRCIVRGETRWLHAESRPSSPAGGGCVWTGITYDITSRKESEHTLELFRFATEQAADAVFWMKRDASFHYVNDQACRSLGYTREELMRMRIFDIDPIYPTAQWDEDWRQFSSGAISGNQIETTHRRKDGSMFPVEISSRHFHFGATELHVAFVRDITERRQAETARLELERRLLHAQKLESLGVLAGGIAHDFNNLLTAILGNLDLAMIDLPAAGHCRTHLEQCTLAARRAADLTRQMLAYSGRGSFLTRRLDLSVLVQENAHLFRASIPKLVQLTVDAARSLPPIKADPGQIQQVVMNLITNAAESIGERPGLVQLRTGLRVCDEADLRRTRTDTTPAPGVYVFLEVNDTGCGMDETTQQRLFDPFFTTKFTGRGLGMSAILGIVRGHHGAIFVDSQPERGTNIQVLFPAHGTAPAAPETNAPVAPAKAVPTGKILVVDDEDTVRRVARTLLERQGWPVIEAVDGAQAIEVFRRHTGEIRCVLLDLSMPKLGGVETYRALRGIRPDVPVVLCSGFAEDQRAARLVMAEGLAGFVPKPYSSASLLAEIERAIHRP